MPKAYHYPAEFALELLRGKWTYRVLMILGDHPCRYGELRARIATLSDKMLTQRLRELEQKKLIERVWRVGKKPYRVYRLTDPAGESLRPLIEALDDWGSRAAPKVLRPTYDP